MLSYRKRPQGPDVAIERSFDPGKAADMQRTCIASGLLLLAALPTAHAMDAAETARVEALIATVGAATSSRFIRNGREHPVDEAVKLMRYKYDHGGKDLATAEDFIDQHLTRSSTSGKDYQIRTATGAVFPSRDILRLWLPARP